MSITIIAKGNSLFKQVGDHGVEIEMHGAEKSHYLLEMSLIDQGLGGGEKITDAHRLNCACESCAADRESFDLEVEPENPFNPVPR